MKMILQFLIITLLSCASPTSNLNSKSTQLKNDTSNSLDKMINNSVAKEVKLKLNGNSDTIISKVGNLIDFDHNHIIWNRIISKNISSNGKVNYLGIKAMKTDLETYLNALRAEDPMNTNWSRSQKMAFWINTYNAFTIQLIISNYPLKSILNLDKGKVWDRVWIKVGQQEYSLNDIEHKILRPIFKDPRIHFAVNCAAQSCPPMWNRAWTSSNLEISLEAQTKKFVNNKKYNSIGEVSISKIFEWYAQDFGDLVSFINKYSEVRMNSSDKINYKEYDWNLND